MKNDSFKIFILDQLRKVNDIQCRAMFGSFGLYQQGIFFGIISKRRLYFKTNHSTRSEYLKSGMKPFQPSKKQVLKNYYEVPPDIVENPYKLAIFAEKAIRGSLLKEEIELINKS